MNTILNQTAPTIAISCAGIFFMVGLLSGSWKFSAMMRNAQSKAPYYVDVLHRAAFLYSFASMLIAVFAYFSVFSDLINTIATIVPLIFFALAIISYILAGLKNTTNNQVRDSRNPNVDKVIMSVLMVSEIGGFSVLLTGFFIGLL